VIPTGVMGPLLVNGSKAQGCYFVPLATTEGALVASYHRGARAVLECGGVNSVSVSKKIQRCPSFQFQSLRDLALFLLELQEISLAQMQEIAAGYSRFASLLNADINIEGRQLILILEFDTADAAGQNMITVCSDAICAFILSTCKQQPDVWYLESNLGGDKKATAGTLSKVRGQRVIAEARIPKAIINKVLKAEGQAIEKYYLNSTLAAIQSGSIGAQGHYANGLTALFLATGQDVACVSEAATGVTRMEYNVDDESLYVSVTLPNLVCGTVGGGTHLPTQREALELMGCYGPGKAIVFAEVAAATVLCGELSIAAALSSGHFGKAHARFRPNTSGR
ncbi:MAG: hydroxymethylglutaryl-CoA reductase, partial [Bacteroidota bacterium]